MKKRNTAQRQVETPLQKLTQESENDIRKNKKDRLKPQVANILLVKSHGCNSCTTDVLYGFNFSISGDLWQFMLKTLKDRTPRKVSE
jgi:hypothetical protein